MLPIPAPFLPATLFCRRERG
ncbi:MAG: hypothetical protein HW378_4440, partial [Anaerolineales bacterium]|nr:hypothetical protein [Anaerolineales bacterium]